MEYDVYGRDYEKETILKLLLSNDNNVSVIPILGMAGVGKTTLAHLLYEDLKVNRHFDLKAWMCRWAPHIHRFKQEIYYCRKLETLPGRGMAFKFTITYHFLLQKSQSPKGMASDISGPFKICELLLS
ncbi:hypothetical protein FEM48_ZijujUnG0027000 [Ziziphus jujuba var. spinosa]|uniref:NB-ARC domain-containing protein n=1 Tax=Ziziphus jujuba var. spinosa TaxID=714518 RepID=A0A978U9N0_ZIZJJ|nr:hypothetical protein FEM48_ZijujUnG0027000 [Ziziphus jujuba var. spinosa]